MNKLFDTALFWFLFFMPIVLFFVFMIMYFWLVLD